jgi:poly(A) polymerase
MKNAALTLVKTLQKNNFEAYFAGGCVRDMILNIPHDDIDIATNALPDEIEKIFQKTFSIGKHFGVILVEENIHHFEIATFRSDSGDSDGRRPEYVTFTTAKEDALRRDFTINGVFYDPVEKQFHDFVGGKNDIEQKILRFIGDPDQRIQEDYLRILRAVRFKNRFGFEYGASTKAALQKWGTEVSRVSSERIQQEFVKILQHSSRKTALFEMMDFGIFSGIFPEIFDMQKTLQPKDHHSEGNVLNHTLLALDHLSDTENIGVYLATLLHDVGKPYTVQKTENGFRYPQHEEVGSMRAKQILQRFKFSRKIQEKVVWIIRHLSIFEDFFAMKLSTRLHYYDHPFFEDLLTVHKADVLGCVPTQAINIASHKKLLTQIDQIEENFRYSHQAKILPSYKKEFFSGKEIMEFANISAGKKVGEIKEKLRDLQVEGVIKTKEEAEKFVKNFSERRES